MLISQLDHTPTRSDDYYATILKKIMQETPLGTLSPKPRERVYLRTYIIITMAVSITLCSCISTVLIAACVKKSTWKVKSEVSTSSNRVNHEHHKITEPVYATISETRDSVGEMQVEMTNNVAYKSVDFTKTTIFTSVDVDVTRNEAYAVVIAER